MTGRDAVLEVLAGTEAELAALRRAFDVLLDWATADADDHEIGELFDHLNDELDDGEFDAMMRASSPSPHPGGSMLPD